MDQLERAAEILSNAESEMRRLITSAAEAGYYEAISSIVEMASTLAELKDRHSRDRGVSVAAKPSNPPEDGARGQRLDTAHRATPSSSYPRFYRDGAKLVKVGWSKSLGGEYEHKAGKAVVDSVVDAVQRTAAARRRFDVEEMGQVELNGSGSAIPQYQLYLVMGWLRSEGVMQRVGRNAYHVGDVDHLRQRVEEMWDQLSASRSMADAPNSR